MELFSKPVPVYSPTSCSSSFLQPGRVTLFKFSHFSREVVALHCGFNFSFSNDVTISIFLCANLLSVYPLWWSVFSNHLPIYYIGLFSYHWVLRVLWKFCVWALYRYMICKYFLLVIQYLPKSRSCFFLSWFLFF